MSLFEYIRTLDKKFAWSFIGVLLALVFGVVTIYGLLHERKPNLKFEVISNTSVLDVHENVGKLEILFDGNSIKENPPSTPDHYFTVYCASTRFVSIRRL